jgi:hypothetical protein
VVNIIPHFLIIVQFFIFLFIYSENSGENLPSLKFRQTGLNDESSLAAFFWTAEKKCRQQLPFKNKTCLAGLACRQTDRQAADYLNSAVCKSFLVAQPENNQTLTLILPNTIHGCRKLNLGRSK